MANAVQVLGMPAAFGLWDYVVGIPLALGNLALTKGAHQIYWLSRNPFLLK